MEQGSKEWLQLRKTKITATDAPIIMQESQWQTPVKLYFEKIDMDYQATENPLMKRGRELEPFARSLFTIETGIQLEPKVVIKDWAMASLDGISPCGKYVVELKCPGVKYHEMARNGIVPLHYKAQLQHQMWVCDVETMFYYSFDGFEGKCIQVARDPCYLDILVQKEKIFYECLIERDINKLEKYFFL